MSRQRHSDRELIEMARSRGGKILGVGPMEPAADRPLISEVDRWGTHVLVLDRFIPISLNKTMFSKVRHRIKEVEASHRVVETEAIRQGIPKATTARRITFHVTFTNRKAVIDPDNTMKCLIDSLTNAGLLISDRYEHVETMPPVYYLGPNAETRVEMVDIPVKIIERIG